MPRSTSTTDFSPTEDGFLLTTSLRHGGPRRLLGDLTRAVSAFPRTKVLIDLSQLPELDSLGASLLSELLVRGHLAEKDIDYVNGNAAVERGLDRFFYPAPEIREDKERANVFADIGEGASNIYDSAGELLLLISETFYWTIVSLWRSEGHRKGSIVAQSLAIGVGAFPIVGLIAFLIGIVLVLQTADLLQQFGATIFIADGLVVAMFKEMGPLMTAILLAGRSGASIAAEISTMTVTEEIDALKTLALNPTRFIVVPKMWGMTLTIPMLSLMSSVIGVFGGLIIAVISLDLTPEAFLVEAAEALVLKDIITGTVKSLVFGWLIVILAAFYGFRTRGGPEAVGAATTKAVVAALFAVIVADAALGLAFYL